LTLCINMFHRSLMTLYIEVPAGHTSTGNTKKIKLSDYKKKKPPVKKIVTPITHHQNRRFI
jgi:hypothetical protein